ncbi:MAG TPA: lantibiotic dehydratase [Candidatus Baltobacteraceae bacterium]|nr:lantibiotic dehydratase [Candidatus Baltobacteraceae bacterium]
MKQSTLTYEAGRMPLIVARIPHLPTNVALALYGGENAPALLADLLEKRPEVLNAVFIASESLHEAALKWLRSPCYGRVFTRLLMYVIRMSTRTTPFGTFGTVSTVATGTKQTLSFACEDHVHTRSRVDTGWLFEFIRHVENCDGYADELVVAANDLVIERGERLFVMNPERVRRTGAVLQYAPVSLRNTAGVGLIRSLAKHPVTLGRLREALAQDFVDDRARIDAFLARMLESGILVSCLRPTLTEEPLAQVARAIENIDESIAERLSTMRGMLSALDGVPAGSQTINEYRTIVRSVREVFPSDNAVLQVDAKRALSGALHERVVREAGILAEYCARMGTTSSPLDEYAARFVERYEGNDRVVPLLELLDPDFGLGAPVANAAPAYFPAQHGIRCDLAGRALRDSLPAIELEDAEIDALLGPPLSHSDASALEIGFHVLATNAAALERGDFLIFPGAFGVHTGAACSIGRFGDMIACDLPKRLNKSANGQITAELIFHPVMTRAGNVAVRPAIYDYEIQVGIHSHGNAAERLDLRDLFVGMERGRFFLYSRKLESKVRVRETHVLNTAALSGAVPRFLSLLQYSGVRQPRPFSWGDLGELPVLPRLQHNRIVLAPAQWNMPAAIAKGGRKELSDFVARWNVPRFIFACEADNRLLVDLHSAHAATVLNAALKQGASNLRLIEAPVEEESWLVRAGGVHLCEFVASFHLDVDTREELTAKRVPPVNASIRHGLGAEWTCFKIYCGSARADILLQSTIPQLLHALRAKYVIASFFFVRYADPRQHLRLRIKTARSEKRSLLDEMFAALDTLLERGEADDVAVSTYTPEVERYGVGAIAIAEALFQLSSEAALGRMHHFETESVRIACALETCLPMVHALVTPEKLEPWCLRADATRPLKIDAEERAMLRALRSFVHSEAFDDARGRYLPFAAAYHDLEQSGKLERPLFEVIEALIHMHFNRFGVHAGAPEVRARALLRAACMSIVRSAAPEDGSAARADLLLR